jgi:CRP-like cAMP-binding protein
VNHSQNRLLAALSADVLARLATHLKPADLVPGATIFDGGRALDRVYFPLSGAVSLVVRLNSGKMVEAAIVGSDSVLGAGAALGRVAPPQAVVQIGGTAATVGAEPLWQIARESEELRTVLIRHEQAILAQAQQSAACNAAHPVEARLARWLLRTRDAAGSDMLPLTQELVADVLGVRRTSVSVAAQMLQEAGFIRYRRGHIRICDLNGLQGIACECYSAVKAHYDSLLSDDVGTTQLHAASSGGRSA